MVRFTAGLPGLLTLSLVQPIGAFYIPGWSLKSYEPNERIPLLVNKAFSDNTQLQYAYNELPFVCPPSEQPKEAGDGLFTGQSIRLNLGEVLRGDRIVTSDMELEMGKDKKCAMLCRKNVTREALERSRDIVRDGYEVEWIVDNLPGATTWVQDKGETKFYSSGFPLGFTHELGGGLNPQYFLNNHFTIVIRHRKAPGRAGARGEKLIVGFEIYPRSLGPGFKRDEHGCPVDMGPEGDISQGSGLELLVPREVPKEEPADDTASLDDDDKVAEESKPILEIPYTYSVYFKEDETIEWSHRWDRYLDKPDTAYVHYLAIVNSLIICGMLTGVVMIILARTVRSDIQSYKDSAIEGGKLRKKGHGKKSGRTGLLGKEAGEVDVNYLSDEGDEALEDVTGWKLLHADVFRAPRQVSILAPLVGSGTQLLFMAVGLVLLSAAGVLNPSFRGGFISVGVGLFVLGGVMAGYYSGRLYRSFGGTSQFRNAVITEGILPAVVLPLVLVQDIVVWAHGSSTAIPFTTIIALLLLWAGVQIPLVHFGSWYAFRRAAPWEHPTKATSIPRQIPKRQPWFLHTVPSIVLSGLIPFAVIFIELLYIFQSLWQDKSHYYYAFGFLALVSSLVFVTVAEISVVATYVRLGAEDHAWQWRAFATGASSAVWVFGYSVWYYFVKMGGRERGLLDGWLFFAYSAAGCAVYGVVTGAVGFLAAYAFVRKIYGAIKVD
ncbi:hypothetical protein NLU13_4835 [Sarocladium strictum]|uniref:Transmembrane 9 superfamily member n=1 Tax=Sarocladium strictum TaxID=5046 RepID=A0AA39L918_SARSR|nr:hypothetical protein NLU13_4835 [Sarocladium strictum]